MIKEITPELYVNSSVEELLLVVQKVADEKYDGHYSIFSFSTNFKAVFGTVNDVYELRSMKGSISFKEALIDLLVNDYNVFDENYLPEDTFSPEFEEQERFPTYP